MPYLLVREPGRVAFTIDVGETCVLGREPDSDIVVRDRLVSRRHLRFERRADGTRVVDLSSTHGTFVNGASAAERRLSDRDQVQAGNVVLVFREGERPAPDAVFSVTPALETRPRAGSPEELQLRLLFDVSRAIGALGDADELEARLLAGVLDALGA